MSFRRGEGGKREKTLIFAEDKDHIYIVSGREERNSEK